MKKIHELSDTKSNTTAWVPYLVLNVYKGKKTLNVKIKTRIINREHLP